MGIGAGQPGTLTRFSDEDWFELLDGQEGQSVVDELIHHLVEKAQQQLLERQVERRLIPYTVAAGRAALDFLINVLLPFFHSCRPAKRCTQPDSSLLCGSSVALL